jgi:hypothetical protein
LVLSPKSASVAIFDVPSATFPSSFPVETPLIYVPTATGPSAGHVGHALPETANVLDLANQVMTSMREGHSLSITLGGSGGTLVLNGATLSFVVVQGGALGGGATPSG